MESKVIPLKPTKDPFDNPAYRMFLIRAEAGIIKISCRELEQLKAVEFDDKTPTDPSTYEELLKVFRNSANPAPEGDAA